MSHYNLIDFLTEKKIKNNKPKKAHNRKKPNQTKKPHGPDN